MKRYYPIFDGGQPFEVEVDEKNKIFTVREQNPYVEFNPNSEYDILLMNVRYKNILIGKHIEEDNSTDEELNGGAVLILKSTYIEYGEDYEDGREDVRMYQYIEVSNEIRQFETTEPILEYYAYVGNSRTAYPIAYTKNYYICTYNDHIIPKTEIFVEPTPGNNQKIWLDVVENENNKNSLGTKTLISAQMYRFDLV